LRLLLRLLLCLLLRLLLLCLLLCLLLRLLLRLLLLCLLLRLLLRLPLCLRLPLPPLLQSRRVAMSPALTSAPAPGRQCCGGTAGTVSRPGGSCTTPSRAAS
jgi:hypothetical protein